MSKPVPVRLSSKKAKEAARLAEEARLLEEARIAEETRLAEEAKKEAERPKDLDTCAGQHRDLVKWLNSLPLSQKCFNRLDRELSDGVVVAEIIAFYFPEICQSKRFERYSSAENKRSNWEFLNKKVFPKLGFKMTGSTISNILQPFACGKFQKSCAQDFLIYKLLIKLQGKLDKLIDNFYDYRKEGEGELNCKNVKNPEAGVKKSQPRTTWDSICSKIEIQLANGTYDDIYKKRQELDSVGRSDRDRDFDGYCNQCLCNQHCWNAEYMCNL